MEQDLAFLECPSCSSHLILSDIRGRLLACEKCGWETEDEWRCEIKINTYGQDVTATILADNAPVQTHILNTAWPTTETIKLATSPKGRTLALQLKATTSEFKYYNHQFINAGEDMCIAEVTLLPKAYPFFLGKGKGEVSYLSQQPLLRDGLRIVASKGHANDWVAYVVPLTADGEYTERYGYKISQSLAEALFPWITKKYRP